MMNPDGIYVLFTDEHVGTVWVTRPKKLIESVVEYFSLLKES